MVFFFVDAVRRIMKELKENSSKLNIKMMMCHMIVFGTTVVSLIVYVVYAVNVQNSIEILPNGGFIDPSSS